MENIPMRSGARYGGGHAARKNGAEVIDVQITLLCALLCWDYAKVRYAKSERPVVAVVVHGIYSSETRAIANSLLDQKGQRERRGRGEYEGRVDVYGHCS